MKFSPFLRLVFVWVPILAFSWSPSGPFQIVFVHLGSSFPSYLPTALEQAHLFNPKAEIVLIANQSALDSGNLSFSYVATIAAEEILQTTDHQTFSRRSSLDRGFREGFWYYATERIFYLDDLIQQYDLKNVFHLENDNMLYADLEKLLPVFQDRYPGIAAPFEQDNRGAASFIYIADKKSISAFAKYLLSHATSGESEMFLLSNFKNRYGTEYADHLPVVMDDYALDHPLTDLSGHNSSLDPKSYSRNLEAFGSLFDMCSYGQYLGGIDPRNGPDGPGYLNPSSVFLCSNMEFTWEKDDLGRRAPYAIYRGQKYRINNLHIHCKNLRLFSSLEP